MRFKKFFRIESIETEGIFLLSERGSSLIIEQLSKLLVPLIDRHRTVEEIIEEIQSHLLTEQASDEIVLALAKVHYALMQLKAKGYITEDNNILPSDLVIFCEHLNLSLEEANRRLKTTKVAVKSVGHNNIFISQFKSTLESLHIQISKEADIEVVITDDYLHEELEVYNQQALHLSRPWILVKPVGTIIWIGPLFIPGKTGCWRCLAQRLQANRPVETFIQRKRKKLDTIIPPLSSLPATIQTAFGMTATEVFKWIVQGKNKQLEGILLTQDTLSLKTQNHILVKRPQCPDCGQNLSIKIKPLPITLGHRKKTSISEQGYRVCSPEETLKKYEHHISPITGVVRELVKIEPVSNRFIHLYSAKHHFATIFDDLDTLKLNLRGRSGGSGRTDQQARLSSFCEAIERYSGVFQGDEIRLLESYQKMGAKAIHPNDCMNFSQAQYQNRQEWNAKCSGAYGWFQRVPKPFDEAREIDWTPVWSLTQQQFKYLPTAYCYYDYPNALEPDCWADSNGCAAGNTLEEAIVHGFMELVERDCVALWWYNRLKKPRVALDSFDEPYFQALNDFYRSIHREVWILDITSDLNIPAFAAISRRIDREIEDIIFDFGAHFDAKIAIHRALNGLNKILHAVLVANPDGSTHYPSLLPRLALDWWKTATLENQPYLIPDENVTPKVYSDYYQLSSEDLLEDIMTCQQIVEKNGMELLVLDQTRADIGLKVVKVFVPGLRHFWKRLGTGRLYDVPVKMGWLNEPLSENELNPFPMWM
ncbi:TOMM precursor leader peptide-binding protein [Floridanema evergladense]|uniref:TOMM leader peptide-binding protein n=1 Tax=Floridaenema evergladense BLCC-F167 TaxID=3153639 RepID=A0ABV4WN84_9CYAN